MDSSAMVTKKWIVRMQIVLMAPNYWPEMLMLQASDIIDIFVTVRNSPASTERKNAPKVLFSGSSNRFLELAT